MGRESNSMERLALKLKQLDEEYAKDPWRWMKDQVITIDESRADERLIRWPDKYYLQDLLEVLKSEPRVVIPKSRQMMISWLAASFFVHTARYSPNAAIFWQSEIEQKAAFGVDRRCLFIENHLRFPELRIPDLKIHKTKIGMAGKIEYPNGSFILALAQGGDTLRAYTATKILIDECEFQKDAPDAVRAALPLVQNGAQLILVSSSAGPVGVVAGLCRDVGFMKWTAGRLRRVAA